MTIEETKMMECIDQNLAEIISIGKRIWDYKELGGQEVESAALLSDSLEKHGFVIEKCLTGVNPVNKAKVDFPTAFKATYECNEGGPHIGILLEYDALPNGHSCGHNLIAEAGYAAALVLQEALKTVNGKLEVFGTPAEETVGAKIYLLEAGHMDGVDIMFATHPGHFWSSELNLKAMIGSSSDRGLIFTGRSAHASNCPEKGRSAFDAAMLMGMGLEFLREHISDSDRIHYGITKGGSPCNIIPANAEAHICLRSDTTKGLDDLRQRVEKVIDGAAMMTETEAEYSWYSPWLNAVQVPELWHFVAETAADLGLNEEMFTINTKATASSDAGNVGDRIPTANIWFPVSGESTPNFHSDEFCIAAGQDCASDNAILTAKIIALSAYRLYTDTQRIRRIKDDFLTHKNN